jgi:Na+/H+ antiporter NhaD/arsenite permease-like protein
VQTLVACLFALTYLGMAAGRVPGLKLDRTGIALIVAVLLVAVGALPTGEVAAAIHFPTLLLLAGLMVLSARFRAAGLYERVAAWIGRQSARPLRLLALTIAMGGLLSAILINDIVVFAMTPILCASLAARRLDPRPYLFGLAAASNAGSAATLIGNPQNVLIGQVGRLDFWNYALVAVVPAMAAMAAAFVCVALVWRKTLASEPAPVPASDAPTDPPADRRAIGLCLLALLALLALFATPMPRELSALLVAGALLLSRTVPTRQMLDEIDAPLLILFASLFVINGALSATGLPQGLMDGVSASGASPDSVAFLAPFSLIASNTIGNVPAVMVLLEVWRGVPEGALVALAVLTTLAGNLLLVGSLANLIVAERAAASGVRLTFRDHARAGVPMTMASVAFAALWLWALGFVSI